MSMSAAAVFVLAGGHDEQDVRAALPSRFRSTLEPGAPAWDVPDLADGRVMLVKSPVGFDILILRYASSAHYAERDAVDEVTRDVQGGAERLGLLLAYVTRYEEEWALPWIEDNVLVPLLMDEPQRIPLDGFERLLVAPRPLP